MTFRDLVGAEFDFLVREHGFELAPEVPDSSSDAVLYRKSPLALHVGLYKGELDVELFVDIEFTTSHPVFKPYLSRTFALHEVLRALGQRMTPVHESGGFILTQEQTQQRLASCARALKQHCVPLLHGDLTTLEEITKQRSGGGARS